jgi:hypothetical protein
MRLLTAILTIVVWSFTARCDMFDGNELFDLCKREPQTLNGYVAGLYDKSVSDATFAEFWAPDQQSKNNLKRVIRPFCIPDGVQLIQMKDVVCQYLTDAPQQRHLTGSALVQTALGNAFPCR